MSNLVFSEVLIKIYLSLNLINNNFILFNLLKKYLKRIIKRLHIKKYMKKLFYFIV